MKTSTDPGSKKKAIPQSERARVVTPRTGRTCSWWKREGTGQGVVGLEREKEPQWHCRGRVEPAYWKVNEEDRMGKR